MNFARIGFVGCGSHASNNIYPMLKYARCELQAVCDINEQLLKRNARVFGAKKTYTDVSEMLAREDLDGVLVVGPPDMHYKIGKMVLERGINLFVEKPPTPDLGSTKELVLLAREKGVFVMPGFMKRYALTYKKVRELISSGEFDPVAGFFKFGHWANLDLRGMLLRMEIHPLDLAMSFFGDVASVTTAKYENPRSISLAITLRFRSGKWAQLMLDSSQPRIQERVEISGVMNGDNALIVVNNIINMEVHTQRHSGVDFIIQKDGKDVSADFYEIDPFFELSDILIWHPDFGVPNMAQNSACLLGYMGEVRGFIDAILEKRMPYPSGDDAIKAMEIIDIIAKNPSGTVEL